MLNVENINNKLIMISEYLTDIQPFLKYTNEEIRSGDKGKLRNIERLIQLVVDSAIDINTSIIANLELEGPNDYAGTFTIVSRSQIFPLDFAEKISKSVGLRNQIVHQYEKVDVDKMLNDIKNNIGDYIQYVKYVHDFLYKEGNKI